MVVCLRKSIQDKCRNEQGLTIVEVMVSFVLVLLSIAMITTVTFMTTKIQKNVQESQNRTTQLTELAYQKLQLQYNSTEPENWKIRFPEGEVKNKSAAKLDFGSFSIDVQTADWEITSATDPSLHAMYHIYYN